MARSLSAEETAELQTFFAPATLGAARVRSVPRIENPDFYAKLPAEFPTIKFTQMMGITLIDTVLISDAQMRPEDPLLPLLFHELVHVVQYAQVGVETFVDRYVTGWYAGGQDYGSIPIEKQAYGLGSRYEANPGSGFSVEAFVQSIGVP